MDKKSDRGEENKQVQIHPHFHQRFNIEVDDKETINRFVNRVSNLIVDDFFEADFDDDFYQDHILWEIANSLGKKYVEGSGFDDYVQGNFYDCLRALEAAYTEMPTIDEKEELSGLVHEVISLNEVDLGIVWEDGIFRRSGAELLDTELINQSLNWLSDPKYADVLLPFQKGLRHFLEARGKPEKLADVITDMYEALEKMARISLGNNRTLGVNAEKFVGNLGLSNHYETMLREYTKYAHEFRHAVEQGKGRVPPLPNEVEAFVYTTGLFIRLAIQQLATT